MKMVSVIMPTRSGSHDSLRKAVRSILDAPGTNKDDLEILLRLDDDDPERFFVAEELTKGVGSFVVGTRGAGYNDMGRFVFDLVRVADSKWCWLVDDDAWVEGAWYPELSKYNCDCAVNAQYYHLGPSKYENGAKGGPVGLIIPTALALTLPTAFPVDQVWLEVVMQKGWICNQMKGVSYFHCGRAR